MTEKVGYLHINNLAKDDKVLLFKEVWATEKVHGTSAHVSWNPDQQRIVYFSGGASAENFRALFDEAFEERFMKLVDQNGKDIEVVVYGEAYGGKMQGMRLTYGNELRFIAFEVRVGCHWLNFDKVREIAKDLGLEVVPGKVIPATEEALTEYRNSPSEVAVLRGCQDNTDRFGNKPPLREGIVIRPLVEMRTNDNSRVMAKFKNPCFSERESRKDADFPSERKQEILKAEAAAKDFTTETRLEHVLDALGLKEPTLQDTPKVIKGMVEDILREGAGEVEDSKTLRREIGRISVKLFRQKLGIL